MVCMRCVYVWCGVVWCVACGSGGVLLRFYCVHIHSQKPGIMAVKEETKKKIAKLEQEQ